MSVHESWLEEIAAEEVKRICTAEEFSTHCIAMGYDETVFLSKRILTKLRVLPYHHYLILKRSAYNYGLLMAVREPGYHFPFSII